MSAKRQKCCELNAALGADGVIFVEESDGLGVVADGSDGEESSPQEPIPVRVVGETFESYRRRLNAYRAGQRRIQGPDDTLH